VATARTAPAATGTINLQRIKRETAIIEIEGTAPLIVKAWSQKAREMMLAGQQGRKAPKENKDPQKDFEESMYKFDDGSHGFPTLGIKSATVKGGARAFGKTVKMTELRQSLLFHPDGLCTDGATLLTKLEGSAPHMREDMVRLGGVKADIRYRAQYDEWSATLRIEFLPNVISLDSIVALVDAGGMNGLGEWRPEKSGYFGTFQVVGA
jgi:hypothetical protein